jgi:hypothetical protein
MVNLLKYFRTNIIESIEQQEQQQHNSEANETPFLHRYLSSSNTPTDTVSRLHPIKGHHSPHIKHLARTRPCPILIAKTSKHKYDQPFMS